MGKVANFTKETLKNGALVAGGHRVKYVSDDKEFIILATRFGTYQGFYLVYENDGAYVDAERTPAPSAKVSFNTLDECKRYFKVGEFAEKEEDVAEEKAVVAELPPMMKQFRDLKAKHPDVLLLFRCGDFYEAYEDDAQDCSSILGITLTKRYSNNFTESHKLAGFPYHSLDTYLPKLIRAGKRVAICDQLEDPKMTKNIVKRGITDVVSPATEEKPKAGAIAKEVKMEAADELVQELTINAQVSSQIEMRKIVTEACKAYDIALDHVSIWQHNGNGDYGLAVAFDGKKPVAVVNWERNRSDGKTTYSFVGASGEKYQELRKRI